MTDLPHSLSIVTLPGIEDPTLDAKIEAFLAAIGPTPVQQTEIDRVRAIYVASRARIELEHYNAYVEEDRRQREARKKRFQRRLREARAEAFGARPSDLALIAEATAEATD